MSDGKHWSEQKEHFHRWQMSFILTLVRFLPGVLVRIVAVPIGFFYWMASGKQRKAISEYLSRINSGRCCCTLKVFLAFAITVIEKVESWAGKIKFGKIAFQKDDINEIWKSLEQNRGALLICSHLGNMELLRAIADCDQIGISRRVPIISVVDFAITSGFNQMLKEMNPSSMLHLISADDVGPDTMIQLQEHIASGGIVVIAGDRSPAGNPERIFELDFLGKSAQFPQGPFVIASLLDVPTYFVFAMRQGTVSVQANYNMHIHRSSVAFACGRSERQLRIKVLAEEFVRYLEKYCKKYPYQWYNFYEFWEKR